MQQLRPMRSITNLIYGGIFMSIANLLRRALVHYSRCSGRLTLPPSDLKAGKSDWANYMAEEHLRTNPQMLALLPKDFLKNVPHSL